jgi:hypothetical protein
LIVFLIFYIAKIIIEKTKFYAGDKRKLKFMDIIRGQDLDPSLSIFQFLLWTGVIIFAFTAVYFIRILGGVYYPPAGGIPELLLALMGISIGVPIVSTIISGYKYTPNNVELYKETPSLIESGQELPGFHEMLNEYGKPSLGRFQMFAWTWISIIIYLFIFFSKIFALANTPSVLALPDIDPTLVVLMGLSQFAFLGNKAVTSEMEITSIFPLEGSAGDSFSIYGNNFGNKGQIVWIGTKRIPSLEKEEEEETIKWSNNRIDIKIPKGVPLGKQEIKVVIDGSWITAKVDKFKEFTVVEKPNTAVNPPKANDMEISTDQNKPIEITLTATSQDNSKLKFSKVKEPDNGKANIIDELRGKVTYEPNSGYVGPDSFQFKVNDGKADSNTATVKITVNKPNTAVNPPKANDMEISTDQNKPIEIILIATSQDDGAKLTFSKVSEPLNGQTPIFDVDTGKVTYEPNSGYVGPDSFQFKVNDGKADSNTATVKITVNKPNIQ